jgi:hypothetical protein
MSVEVNWIAVLLAAASSMVVGAVWYAKGVFGKTWIKLVGLDEKRMGERVAGPMTTAVVGGLLEAYVIAHVAFMTHEFFDTNSFLMDAVTTAFWLWLGISATTLAIHNTFEHRPWKLTLLSIANQFVTLMAMGVIIGLLKP